MMRILIKFGFLHHLKRKREHSQRLRHGFLHQFLQLAVKHLTSQVCRDALLIGPHTDISHPKIKKGSAWGRGHHLLIPPVLLPPVTLTVCRLQDQLVTHRFHPWIHLRLDELHHVELEEPKIPFLSDSNDVRQVEAQGTKRASLVVVVMLAKRGTRKLMCCLDALAHRDAHHVQLERQRQSLATGVELRHLTWTGTPHKVTFHFLCIPLPLNQ